MLVPNCEQALVAEAKVRDYLLDPRNPQNRGKAAFFARMGYVDPSSWPLLSIFLSAHVRLNEVVSVQERDRGTVYNVVGPLPGIGRPERMIRTTWQIDWGDTVPRFITAVPYRRKGGSNAASAL